MRLLKFLCWSALAVFCGLLLSLSGAYLYLSPGLPSVESLRSIQLQIPLRVYSSDSKLIAEFGEMRRSPIRFQDIPPDFINAIMVGKIVVFSGQNGADEVGRKHHHDAGGKEFLSQQRAQFLPQNQ